MQHLPQNAKSPPDQRMSSLNRQRLIPLNDQRITPDTPSLNSTSESYFTASNTSSANRGARPRRWLGFETRMALQAYAFLLPSLLGLLLFLLLPVIAVAVLSFF